MRFLTVYKKGGSAKVFDAHPTAEAAVSAATKDENLVAVGQPEDLKPVSTDRLLEIVNLVSEPKVKRFSDRKAAERRAFKVMQEMSPEGSYPEPVGEQSDQPNQGEASPAPQGEEPEAQQGDEDMAEKAAKKGKAKAAPKKEAKAKKAPAERKVRTMKFDYPAGKELKAFREGTKRAKVVEMLKDGATFEQVQKACGWSRKDAYEGIRLVNSRVGYGLKQLPDGKIKLVAPAKK